MKLLLLYFHTLRYLKLAQIVGRLAFRFSRKAPDIRPAPLQRPSVGHWVSCARKVSMQGPAIFHFLAVTRTLSGPADWNRRDWPKLWVYNLHYFDDLNADHAVTRVVWHQKLINRWVHENPPAAGNGWEPYPTSLRIVNWIKWALAGNQLDACAMHSLAVQARWLYAHIEWHLLGNHLLANAKALVFAGMYFNGPEADTWREQGLAILQREYAEQILSDGGHFERSPMYHAIILEDLLDLIQAGSRWPGPIDADLVSAWRLRAAHMQHWLAAMTHPDGEIAFFNDAATGIAPSLSTLTAHAANLSIVAPASVPAPLVHLNNSGYVRVQKGSAILIADVGAIGPDYLPGHAHADTLSFELSVAGQRVVVNSGTSVYGLGEERQRQRGTAVHSTVQVDGADSSEVWSGFRVARRAQPVRLALHERGEDVEISCAHDGYLRLRGRTMHHRAWHMSAKTLLVTDTVEGRFREAIARYHFHPEITVSVEDAAGVLELPDGHTIRWSATGAVTRIVDSTWHPAFGVSVPSKCIELVFDGPRAMMAFDWH